MAERKPRYSFSELSTISLDLNKRTDEFAKVIDDLGRGLQRLNVGIPVWILVGKYTDEDDSSYEIEKVGYDKWDGTWGIYIREQIGDEQSPEPDRVTNTWAFNNAGRDIRLRCAEKLPELIDALARAAANTTDVMTKRIETVRALASAVNVLTPVEIVADKLGIIGAVKK